MDTQVTRCTHHNHINHINIHLILLNMILTFFASDVTVIDNTSGTESRRPPVFWMPGARFRPNSA
jgi:hypothetical protein